MGILRGIWRSTGIGRTIDTVKNIVEEGSIKEGYKRTLKEDMTEDNPIGKMIYQSGKYDGKEEGYAEASDEYEQKLIEMGDQFLAQKKVYEQEKEAYNQLMEEYEAEIERLEAKASLTEAENDYLRQLLLRERNLRKMANG